MSKSKAKQLINKMIKQLQKDTKAKQKWREACEKQHLEEYERGAQRFNGFVKLACDN